MKKVLVLMMSIAILALSFTGCSQMQNGNIGENSESQAGDAQSEYDRISEVEIDGKTVKTGILKVTSGEVWDAISDINGATATIMADLDEDGKETGRSVLIDIDTEDYEAFLDDIKTIFNKDAIKRFEMITFQLTSETSASVSITKDQSGEWSSYCMDRTDGKKLESVYERDEFFRQMDHMTRLQEDLDNLR